MAKIRVHELAKELNIQTKDIITYLGNQKIEVTSHMSTLDDGAVQMVRNKYTKKADTSSAEVKKVSDDGKTAERPKKKSSISAVYNPQNSKMGDKRSGSNGQRPQGARPARSQGDRPRYQSDRQGGAQGDRPRYQSDRPAGSQGDRPRYQSDRQGGAQGDRPRYQSDRPARAQGDRPRYQSDRQGGAQGDRPRYQSDRPARPQGDRPRYQSDRQSDRPRYQSDRPAGSQGDRPRYQSDRPVRPRQENGERYARNERTDKNGQRNYQNNRGGFNNRQGDRNSRQDGQNYSREPKKRLEQEIFRMNKDTAKPAAEEFRGKDSRDTNRKNTKKQNYDKTGGKKQERYVNLEKKTGHKKRNAQPQQPAEKKEEVKTIILPEIMTVRELADKMKIQASAIVKKLFLQGEMLTVNQEINYEKAEEIALEFNCIAEPEEKVDVIAELLKEEEEAEETMVSRAPVVCVMGHVDHGKTSLLDAIRSTRVTDREAGGITQHIGASVVTINNQNITFLDTPGHEAFTAMRMRGASSTDIAILVVAADDGVMPQTVEAINHAKAAGIEIIVAINKIDKPGANIEKVKQGLSEYELIPEDWGGSTIFVPVSAKTRDGIDQLLEMVLLTAEILELKANPNRNARGLVIEAQLDKGRGAVATVLVQKGTLKVGQPVAAGSCYGKVRAMLDDQGRRVKEAGPSIPVEILGLNSVPNAGEVFVACDSEKDARSFAETFVSQDKERLLEETRHRMSLDDLFSKIQAGSLKELNLIVKADVQGSVEAVKQSLTKLSNEEVVVKVIHGGVGAINESDVTLASASDAIIIGFNVKPDVTAKSIAEQEGIDMRLYSVIYNAIEDIEAAMKGMLDPIFEEKVLGHAEIRQLFKASGVGTIAGSYILDGSFERGCKVRISREGNQIFEGNLASLKRFKDDVKEVKAGYECGLVFEGFNDFQELDIVEAYKMVEVPR
ncbi:Translation initiation factor IF-2 [uncultured Roseburia sp.]|uniref:Translation initiation factor IF-2 n=1 Tax=Brotonthovivens ammoniilytica TaxID=2981725 RepID=A0ABT2TGS7_9FIRM|nr:translation initiation factor IF-2 [Brotonthovivens ammoniilytica]MCU6761355.1 translation initiation factor IF-2 [Brotonthovivens ammoniilytica]SCI26109.1 Translation initiation factor IF-2 [uncultured Roseburia sp.]